MTNPRGGIGLYNKPSGCNTSVALATGPNDEEEEEAQAHRILFQFKVGHIHQNWHAPYMPIHL